MSNEEELMDLFNNLKIESDDEDEEFEDNIVSYDEILDNYTDTQDNNYLLENDFCPDKYNNLMKNIFSIIGNDPTFTAEIVDNIVIIDNILYGLNPLYKDDLLPIKAILRLSEFHNQKIPQRGDPIWWDSKCSKFEDMMSHLRNSSCENNKKFDNNDVILINQKIVELACKLVQIEFECRSGIEIKTSLFDLFNIANYLESYFYNKKIGSFYSKEINYS